MKSSIKNLEVKIVKDTAVEMAKRMLVDSIWKSANIGRV